MKLSIKNDQKDSPDPNQLFTLSRAFGLTLQVRLAKARQDPPKNASVELHFDSAQGRWASGVLTFSQPWRYCEFGHTGRGDVRLRITFAQGHWTLRLRGLENEPVIEVLETADVSAPPWQLIFPATTLHWHKQLSDISAPAEIVTTATATIDLRLGAHSQHGQLFNYRDWFLAEKDGFCSGIIVLRPGSWTHPKWTSASVGPAKDHWPAAAVSFPLPGRRIRRSFLLVHAAAKPILEKVSRDDPSDLGREPFAAWPARRMARHGFARPERLAQQRRLCDKLSLGRPAAFAFGDQQALNLARRRIAENPALAGGNPFWRDDFAAARDHLFSTLNRFHAGLTEAGYLHPLGNPVACRELGPTAAMFHLLDYSGELSAADRSRAAGLIADLASLLQRRDFYPWHFCHQPPEVPYDQSGSHESLYRGMLNQNFHTDVYVFVGLAGCLLPGHPHAARWRRHAIDQFNAQMRCFVWPFPDGYGCWEESHTYANHVKLLLLPLALALRHLPADQRVYLLQNPAFRAMCRFFLPLLSPPDTILDGHRGILAIGDHGYRHHGGYGYLFGWLANLCPEEKEAYLWAWGQTGAELTQQQAQVSIFSPLLQADPTSIPAARAPTMPDLLALPGYGAMARTSFNTPEESLLVIRCGDAWGHYHPDESSFWWYYHRQLLCADADLGGGPLKLQHLGHNVLGFPNHKPVQHLDRAGYQVTTCRKTPADGYHLRCRIPFPRFDRAGKIVDLPPDQPMPLVIRTFYWDTPETLRIIDEPTNSPDGLVQWTLHLPATTARIVADSSAEFTYPGGLRLCVHLPQRAKQTQLEKLESTWRLTCIYTQQPLEHRLQVGA
jgi:hypothetical protein